MATTQWRDSSAYSSTYNYYYNMVLTGWVTAPRGGSGKWEATYVSRRWMNNELMDTEEEARRYVEVLSRIDGG